MPADPQPAPTADPEHVGILLRTRPWLLAAAILAAAIGLAEGGLAVHGLLTLGPPPDESYAAGRWSTDLTQVPLHAAASAAAAVVAASLAREWAVVGRLRTEASAELVLQALRHQRGCLRGVATAAVAGLALGCAGAVAGVVVAVRIVAAQISGNGP